MISERHRTNFLPLLDYFLEGSSAKLCFRNESFYGLAYDHYYITNDAYTIEFGGGQLCDNTVTVHCRPMPTGNVFEESSFTVDAACKARMQQVVGATGYSLCLRNCEHVARFIQSGSWVCMQMIPKGKLHMHFHMHMMAQSLKLSNSLPRELAASQGPPQPLHVGRMGPLRLTVNKKQGFSPQDENAFNIVFLGPTGCGKSSIINHLFNANVSPSGDTAASVTRQITIFEGQGTLKMQEGRQISTVNVIDTIGFCDALLKEAEVVDLITWWLNVQKTTIDAVVVVVSGRLEQQHTSSIKKVMKWLDFERHAINFYFVYNKADTIQSQATVTENVAFMASQLETGSQSVFLLEDAEQRKRRYPRNLPLGVPPNASFDQATDLMKELVTPLLAIPYESGRRIGGCRRQRVPVSTSDCSIL